MMRIRSLYIHISRSSINASRAPSNWSRDAFVSFFFVRGAGREEKNSNTIHTFPNARKNIERDV